MNTVVGTVYSHAELPHIILRFAKIRFGPTTTRGGSQLVLSSVLLQKESSTKSSDAMESEAQRSPSFLSICLFPFL